MSMNKKYFLITLILWLCLPVLSHAQNIIARDLNESEGAAGNRYPTDLAPRPVQWRGFFIQPSLELSGEYQSNIFFQNADEESDFIYTVKPAIEIEKKFADHRFSFSGDIAERRFWDNNDENTRDYNLEAKADIGVTGALKMPFTINYSRSALSRSTPGSLRFTTEPINSKKISIRSGLSYRFNRLNLSLIGNAERRSFENGISSVDSSTIVF